MVRLSHHLLSFLLFIDKPIKNHIPALRLKNKNKIWSNIYLFIILRNYKQYNSIITAEKLEFNFEIWEQKIFLHLSEQPETSIQHFILTYIIVVHQTSQQHLHTTDQMSACTACWVKFYLRGSLFIPTLPC